MASASACNIKNRKYLEYTQTQTPRGHLRKNNKSFEGMEYYVHKVKFNNKFIGVVATILKKKKGNYNYRLICLIEVNKGKHNFGNRTEKCFKPDHPLVLGNPSKSRHQHVNFSQPKKGQLHHLSLHIQLCSSWQPQRPIKDFEMILKK